MEQRIAIPADQNELLVAMAEAGDSARLLAGGTDLFTNPVLTIQEGHLERELALEGVRRGAAGDPVFDCWWILNATGATREASASVFPGSRSSNTLPL